MSYTDKLFIENVKKILSEGVSDEACNVRPRWEDGTPAHTLAIFGVVDRYDLQKEFPIMTLKMPTILRWAIYWTLLFIIAFYGAKSNIQYIYFQF